MIVQMWSRRGTAAQWNNDNPTLASGEWGYETDSGLMKCGDGVTMWASLPYFADIGDLSSDIAEAVSTLSVLDEEVDGFGVWSSYSPDIVGARSVSSSSFRFTQIENLVVVRFFFTLKPSGDNAERVSVTLPVEPSVGTVAMNVGNAKVVVGGSTYGYHTVLWTDSKVYFLRVPITTSEPFFGEAEDSSINHTVSGTLMYEGV